MATGIVDSAFDGADQITGAMECEHYASGIAAMWDWARLVTDAETTNAIGAGVVEIVARSEHPLAVAMLRGLAAVADAPINDLAYSAAAGPQGESCEPSWLAGIGSARVDAAVRVGDPTTDEGTTVLFDLRWRDGQHGGMGIFIDPRLGGCAKHILVGPPLEKSVAMFEDDGEVTEHNPLEIGDAVGIVREAMAVSDRLWSRELGETYPPLRGFVKRQLRNARIAAPRNREA